MTSQACMMEGGNACSSISTALTRYEGCSPTGCGEGALSGGQPRQPRQPAPV